MEIIAVCALCIAGVLFAIYIGEQHKLFGQLIILTIVIAVMLSVMSKLEGLLELVELVREFGGINNTYILLLIKMTGIIFVAEFTADICEQGGYKSIGKQVLLFGRIAVLMTGYPLLLEFIKMIGKFLM